jgi:hypothetical protein
VCRLVAGWFGCAAFPGGLTDQVIHFFSTYFFLFLEEVYCGQQLCTLTTVPKPITVYWMGVLPLSLPRLSLSWALCLSPREPIWTHEMYALLRQYLKSISVTRAEPGVAGCHGRTAVDAP